MKQQQICNILPQHLREKVGLMNLNYEKLQEIRVRIGQYIILQYDGQEVRIAESRKDRITRMHIKEILEYISQYSLYAYEQELKQGYITMEGGHRVGLVGKAILEQGTVKTLKYISAMNIRIAHEVIGCADKLLPYIANENQVYHTLIISPPRCGKTTMLRDVIRQLSDGDCKRKGRTVGVVDERSELGACYEGVPQNHLGSRTDILDACPKIEGLMMLVRSMSPEVIVVDEIGTDADIQAIRYGIHCGCKIIASVHGTLFEDIRKKPQWKTMMENQIFERYIVLSNQPKVGSVLGIYDGAGILLYEDNR